MRIAMALLLSILAGAASAHPAPNSIVRLRFQTHTVHAEYWLPVSELEYARAADPAGDLRAYLLRHVAAQTRAGERWDVAVGAVRATVYLEQPYVVAELDFTPPPGTATTDFRMIDDAVTHEVRNHVIYVVARRDSESSLVGALQYPARTLDVAVR